MTAILPYLIACPLCMLAGFIDSIAGGGGLISLPAYYLALGSGGVLARLSAGTNKLSASFGSIAAVIRYARGGDVAWVPALTATAGALPGAFLGAQALEHIPEALALKIMMFVLPVVCVILLTRRGEFQRKITPGAWRFPAYAVIGLVVGFYDGMIGPGTGTFLILLFSGVTGMPPIIASGSAKVVNLASGVSSLASFMLGGYVDWWLGLAAAAFSIAGNLLGAGFAIKNGAKVIQAVLAVVLALILVTLGVRAAGVGG
ncbi:MAG: TSUP family transporter [Oscillospiraceae bacterium]|nr:TSUP family transporter [Oscillospiraceae bacterium]